MTVLTPDSPRLLHTVDQAGALIQQSRSTIYELIASGELHAIKIGRSRRIPHDALVAYVEKLLNTPSGPDAA